MEGRRRHPTSGWSRSGGRGRLCDVLLLNGSVLLLNGIPGPARAGASGGAFRELAGRGRGTISKLLLANAGVTAHPWALANLTGAQAERSGESRRSQRADSPGGRQLQSSHAFNWRIIYIYTTHPVSSSSSDHPSSQSLPMLLSFSLQIEAKVSWGWGVKDQADPTRAWFWICVVVISIHPSPVKTAKEVRKPMPWATRSGIALGRVGLHWARFHQACTVQKQRGGAICVCLYIHIYIYIIL